MVLQVLDASALANGSPAERLAFGQTLLKALQEDGITKIINHQLSTEEITNVFQACRDFFHLPPQTKAKIANNPNDSQQRGWSKEGEEKTWWLESNKGDITAPKFSDNKESFDHGAKEDVSYPNKWPAEGDLSGYQPLMEDFFEHCSEVCIQLLEVLAMALNVPISTFTSRCTNMASTARINHFPKIEQEKLDSGAISRIWPHNDFGIISLVFPDTVTGLEYEDRAYGYGEKFIPVPRAGHNEVVVLAAETIERWTNKNLKAGLHRVTKPSEPNSDGIVPERTSLVFFCKADRHVKVGPLTEFVKNEEPLFDDLTALEYQDKRNKAHYPDHQSTLSAVAAH